MGGRPRAPARVSAMARRTARSAPPTPAPERLQKLLARSGIGSRREIEGWMRAQRLSVNGVPALLGTRVLPGDEIRLDGRLVRQRAPPRTSVFVCHRSPGEILRSSEEGSLVARLPRRSGHRFIAVSPMPRVDGGLELLTSDGDIAARLQRAMRALECEFSVRVHGELSEEALSALLRGELDRGTLPVIRCESGGGEGSNRWYVVTARGASGKQVRQLFERQGALVSRVLRTRLGTLALERHLSRGQFRELSAEQLTELLSAATGRSAPRPEMAASRRSSSR
jgi:23S rRNA pseudouridine2605 synthase